ncbi:hypothetical protein B0O80DRAFT_65856 [Mortierella sp. GBAus27b]|nr:hypothetical protein B0O80DRAFT_65856 [Mortierella sp. GBAus27b]
MLGRNAARPLGMAPSRLAAACNAVVPHRLAQWMFNRPYAIMHMHRYLFPASQLLLTAAKTNDHAMLATTKDATTATPSSPSSSSSSSSTGGAREVHTSAMLQPQLMQEPLLPGDLHSIKNLPLDDDHPYGATLPPPTTTATAASAEATASSAAAMATENAIKFNYLLAASWHPKSRQRQQQQQQQQEQEDLANAERTMRWKQKLRAAHPSHHHHHRSYPGNVDAGEDAFFHVSTPSRVALGVADGVGGWAEVS